MIADGGQMAVDGGGNFPRPGLRQPLMSQACQTIRRPPEYYSHLMALERGTAAAPAAAVDGLRTGRVRSHCRFRKRGTACLRESGIKWMNSSAKRRCDRTLRTGRESSNDDAVANLLTVQARPGRFRARTPRSPH
jgi:hypothetical protein